MEGHMQKSPNLGVSTDSSDTKYVSGLSTILVATIQETKDRISQIEYIFCSQLFPKFQQNTKSLQKIYSEAKGAADEAYKEKEKDLLLQIQKLQSQNQQVLEDNQLLKLEKEKLVNMENESCNHLNELQEELNQRSAEANEMRKVQENMHKLLESKSSLLHSYEKTARELEEKNDILLRMLKKLEVDSEGLQQELLKKSKEVDDMMVLQNKLLQVNQSKSTLVLQKETQLKEYEEKTNGLISKVENLEDKVNELLSGIREKTEEVEKGKELQGNLLKKIEFQATEIMNNEQLLNKYEKENKLLSSKVGCLTNSADELQKELQQKTSELEVVKKVQEKLLQKSDSSNFEIVKRGQALHEFQEKKVNKLQQSLSERSKESCEGMELHMKLLQQIEVKDSELLSEKRKKKDIIIAYKKLKSQYNYLLRKYNISQETMLSVEKAEGENEVMRHNDTALLSYDIEKDSLKASNLTHDIVKPVNVEEVLEDKREAAVVKRISPASPSTSRRLLSPICPSNSKTCPPAGTKRPSSYWRDTRSHQSRVGPDPHDDFLDTPLENVRENVAKSMKEDIPKADAVNMNLDDSDDHTQDISLNGKPNKQHKSPPRAGTSGFKYVEPVRKKSERENLKGVECKQCKKFYDAVLPDGSNKKNIRCEHHDGVSRHRYRYAPPLTPEGFWNIGFESEM